MLQDVRFGRVCGLRVRGGEPQLDSSAPAPRLVRTVKLGGRSAAAGCSGDPKNSAHPAAAAADFALKREHLELLAHLDAVGDCTVDVIEVRDGLPFLMELEA